ncbi:MAG: hypothetical protein M3297_13115 [Thermoproteota archaeon]|jgi:hypothetical protein|nr:hypothetical protein [Thermoproteota archaeon]
MPEIWLQYGTTDVALDIRYENLYREITPQFFSLEQDQINYRLQDAPLKNNNLIIVFSYTLATKRVLSSLLDMATNKGINCKIMTPAKLRDFSDTTKEKWIVNSLTPTDLHGLKETMTRFDQTMFVTHSAYDPLFGFEGVPSHLLRTFMKDKMSEAFSSRTSDAPLPGIYTEPYRLALSLCMDIDAVSLELLGDSKRIYDICYGSIEDSSKYISSKLIENVNREHQEVKSEIISPGGEPIYHSTLADSLNSLWNCLGMLGRNGSPVLLSESKKGLGSKALQMFVEKKLPDYSSIQDGKYIDGQEQLIFLETVREKFNLGILSTLPNYYLASKLGFETYDGLKQALANLLSRHGKTHKVALVSDAQFTLSLTGPDSKDES